MRYISSFIFVLAYMACFSQLPQIKLIEFATGLSKPVDIKHCKDNRLFVVDQSGKIRIVRPSGAVDAVPFMDISNKVNASGGEQGLLSLAFSPYYKQDGYFFVNYTRGTGAGESVIARYSVNPLDSNLADTASEKIIFKLTQPFNNHNGCDLRFGPDGYLYASFGDGGSANDPQGNGQNMNTLLGKIIRIDPFNGTNYAIPATNPYITSSNALPEIWASGLRNPWRCSFDKMTGDYWIGDVGQNLFEEIDFQPANSPGGVNYGWRCYEASSPFSLSGCSTVQGVYTTPVFEYAQSGQNGCSVTGGYVYRGARFKNMFGKYFNTDFCSGRFWCTEQIGSTFTTSVLNNFLPFQYTTFGEDEMGELYVAGYNMGKLYHLVDTSVCNPVAFLGFKDSLKVCGNELLSTPGHQDLTYAWYLNNNLIQGASKNIYTSTQTGWHKVVVTNTANCTSTDSIYTEILPATSLTLSGLQSNYCLESPVDTIVTSHPGGTITVNGNLASSLLYPAALGVGVFTVNHQLMNPNGCISEAAITITVSACTDIASKASVINGCYLAPNPSQAVTFLNFHTTVGLKTNVLVSDIKGRVVAKYEVPVTPGHQALPISTATLSAGVYIVSLEGFATHLKLIVTH